MIRRPILVAAALLVLVTALALAFGTEPISLSNALAEPGLARTILIDVRLPRVALAAMAGAGLGVVGAAFQALLRNPLAEPYVLGVSGGAALGATTAIALGLGATTLLGAALIPAASLLGGLVATSLVYAVARGMRGGASGTAILLAGVMVNSMAAALITFLKALVPPSRAQQLLRWLVGFVDLPHVSSLLAALVYVGIGCVVLLFDAGRLNVLVLGDETAGTLGVDVRALERRTFLASSCVVGAIVSLTGLIGFVGLVVPHAVRRLIGPDQRRVLPVSLLSGAAMLVGCDLVARLAFRSLGTEPPVGAVTALIGGPAFLVLLRRSGG
ncbi:iron ABC transporter permease [Polyangium sp. y55x31]|uniref:FecCD family ABC transporter permease n=1 Tax=Polyangium sp. y55x31 TaxID=3042688 RepID=UPI0024827201|nr:iron ABC transporter permease [Polyangium sp. y55x31]MDI1481635.1 iron ABC transporter permease [Polyangium sp. y55x31]